MNSKLKFYMVNTILVSIIGTINLGICTAFFSLKSISYIEITTIYSIILLSTLLLEYPSGIIADRFGRKKIYGLGLLFIGSQYLLYAISESIYLLYLAAVLSGVGGALVSGSLQAWIIVEERSDNLENLKRAFSSNKSLSAVIAIIISSLLIFIKGNFELIYISSSLVIFIIAIISIILFKDNYGENKNIYQYNKDALKEIISNKLYLLLTAFFSLNIIFYSIFILFWQPRVLQLGLEKEYITLVYAIYLLGIAIVNLFANKLVIKVGKIKYIILCIIVMTLGFTCMVINNLIVFCLGMIIFGLGYGSLNPIYFSWLSERINTNNCATIISLISALGSIVSIVVNIGLGYVMDLKGLVFIGISTIILGIIFSLIIGIGYKFNLFGEKDEN